MSQPLPAVGDTIYLKQGLAYYRYRVVSEEPALELAGRRTRKGSVVVSGLSQDRIGRDVILYNKDKNAIYA